MGSKDQRRLSRGGVGDVVSRIIPSKGTPVNDAMQTSRSLVYGRHTCSILNPVTEGSGRLSERKGLICLRTKGQLVGWFAASCKARLDIAPCKPLSLLHQTHSDQTDTRMDSNIRTHEKKSRLKSLFVGIYSVIISLQVCLCEMEFVHPQ